MRGSHGQARAARAGALTTAATVAATIFCCLPFATGFLGAGLAALGARFGPFRPYLIGASIAFMGYAFYQAYRPDIPNCEEVCASPASAGYRKLAVWLLAVVVALLLTTSWWVNWVIYWTL